MYAVKGGTYNLRSESSRALESWERVMARSLGQWVETKESFVGSEDGFVLGAGGRVTGEHPKVVRKRSGFPRVEEVFD